MRFGRSRLRSLEVLWNDSIEYDNKRIYLYLLEALDIKLVRKNKDKPGKEFISDSFEWDVIGYNGDFIWLQLDF